MMQAPKKGKKAQKGACSRGNQEESNGEDGNVAQQQQCSSNYLSDDDSLEMTACSNMSSASKKSSSAAGGKARAGRGAATDPQSLYARVMRNSLGDRDDVGMLHACSFGHALACCCRLKLDTEVFLLLVIQKRRERINERLKVLQNLVPNGTKASH